MTIFKKLIRYIAITLIVLIALSPLWLRVVPTKYISPLTGKLGIVDTVVCNFSTKVSGESMIPLINPGSSVTITRCFESSDLTEGTVVLFNDGSNLRIGIIRHVLKLDPIVYKVSDEKSPELFHDIIKEEIEGITKSIDVSKTKYKPKQEEESFIINPNEFLIDLYLAKIPKGMGIEVGIIEKTNSFSRQKDKFCYVVIPKVNLVSVGLQIKNTKTQNITALGDNIVFNTSPSPNVNCQEFGSEQGMLNLDPGSYHFRFLKNHQVLADIEFEVLDK